MLDKDHLIIDRNISSMIMQGTADPDRALEVARMV